MQVLHLCNVTFNNVPVKSLRSVPLVGETREPRDNCNLYDFKDTSLYEIRLAKSETVTEKLLSKAGQEYISPRLKLLLNGQQTSIFLEATTVLRKYGCDYATGA